MTQALGSLTTTWETWVVFLAPRLGSDPALNAVGIWGVESADGKKTFSLSFSSSNKKK